MYTKQFNCKAIEHNMMKAYFYDAKSKEYNGCILSLYHRKKYHLMQHFLWTASYKELPPSHRPLLDIHFDMSMHHDHIVWGSTEYHISTCDLLLDAPFEHFYITSIIFLHVVLMFTTFEPCRSHLAKAYMHSSQYSNTYKNPPDHLDPLIHICLSHLLTVAASILPNKCIL